jgi:hypothetical protein
MQQLITFLTVVGGLLFSLGVALLVEELIFGQVFKLFFRPQPRPALAWNPQPVRVKGQQR